MSFYILEATTGANQPVSSLLEPAAFNCITVWSKSEGRQVPLAPSQVPDMISPDKLYLSQKLAITEATLGRIGWLCFGKTT